MHVLHEEGNRYDALMPTGRVPNSHILHLQILDTPAHAVPSGELGERETGIEGWRDVFGGMNPPMVGLGVLEQEEGVGWVRGYKNIYKKIYRKR